MTARDRVLRWVWLGVAPLPLLAVALVVGTGIGSANPSPVGPVVTGRPATPDPLVGAPAGRPVQIRAGSCAEGGGPIVQTLPDLVVLDGEAAGQERALAAARSVATVPLTLAALLAADHVVTVDRAAAAPDRPIACGAIGGVVDAAGGLTVGLGATGDSGFGGVARLAPAPDGGSTFVSVFLAEG